MSLRGAVEGLPLWGRTTDTKLAQVVKRADVLALIPAGSVLVTVESLAEALKAVGYPPIRRMVAPSSASGHFEQDHAAHAAAILRRLR